MSLSSGNLIHFCRSLRYSLMSGLMLRDTMQLLAKKGARPLRPVADNLVQHLKAGWGLQESLDKQTNVFPPLFMALAAVGEETGKLPEVLEELENYYTGQQKLRREFISEISWPVFQLVAAIFIIAGLIWVLGLIAIQRVGSGVQIDPLGIGLVGEKGALIFLAIVFGTVAALVIIYLILRAIFYRRAFFDRAIMWVPVIGPCLLATALTRFCVSLRLMLETGLSIRKTLRLSMRATDNSAFIADAPKIEASLQKGNSISTSMAESTVFPEMFLSSIAVAEDSGRLTEVLHHQAEEYDELAKRKLALLNKMASWLVWLVVSMVLIVAIFRIFTTVYLDNINKFGS